VKYGLFKVNVIARLHGIDGRLFVPMVRGDHEHRVNVRVRQNLVIVAHGEESITVTLLELELQP
jgi:hypothetical protein